MKIVYWLLVALDTAGLLLMFVLGLAAAPSSRTSGWAVAGFMLVIPFAILAVSIALFTRSTSLPLRALAFLTAAAPLLIVVVGRGLTTLEIKANSDDQGEIAYFHAGPMRDIANAITQNDTATVSRLLPQVKVNDRGFQKTTLLIHALRQLRETPTQHDAIRMLLKAGADPNLGTGESPLELALQVATTAGTEPVSLLLAAGAKPNVVNQFGSPLFFSAVGATTPADVITTLLDHGADIKAVDREGNGVILQAVLTQNWKVALLLLQRGAEWKQMRTVNGLPLLPKLESDLRTYGDSGGLAEVIAYVKEH